MKLVQACLCASNDGESSFHYCGSPVKLVQASLSAEITLQRRFKHRGSAINHLQSWLSASKDGESSFHYCGSPVKLVQACLWAGNTI